MQSSILAAIALATALLSTGAHAQMTDDQARSIVESFYKAFNPAPGRDAAALLRSVTAQDWISCGGNNTCGSRDAVVPGIVGLGRAVPNLTWTIDEVIVAGNKIIVRGEANGTPVGDFIGLPYGGKSFTFMSIDIHTVQDGKIVKTYHVEDMLGAQSQLTTE